MATLKKATELEGKVKGKLFLGGSKPSAEDVQAFNELLGNNNVNLYRWVKNMASYTEAERNAFPAAGKQAAAPAAAKEAKPAAAAKEAPKAAPKAAAKPAADDDCDLFGEETEEEKAALAAKKKAEEDAKKAKKVVIAKSSILLDIKPWDDETNMKEVADGIIKVQKDGLVWGAQKFVEVVKGIKKLQQLMVIEDDKVTSDDIEDIIQGGYPDHVQSIDIVAWNKI
jgi:elongation factor 1-beta